MEKVLSESVEDYLEYLYIKELDGILEVKPIEISRHFSYTRGAVTKAMDKLKEEGYVETEYYSGIKLTPKGREIGKSTYARHVLLKNFLLKIGVSEKNANIDCCKIEHVISEETIEKIIELSKKL